jgi:hypothetical protein
MYRYRIREWPLIAAADETGLESVVDISADSWQVS